jgi:hypothetical protein
MSNSNNPVDRHRREEIRWKILLTLHCNRPNSTRENWILRVLDDIELFPGVSELRQELHYLQSKELIQTTQLGTAFGTDWSASLTAKGVDYVEYAIDPIPGVHRPPQY